MQRSIEIPDYNSYDIQQIGGGGTISAPIRYVLKEEHNHIPRII